MLLSRHVQLGLVHHLDVSDFWVVQRDSHLASELVVLVSDQNVASHVVLTSFDGNDLARDGSSVEVGHLDDVSGSHAISAHKSSSLAGWVELQQKLVVQKGNGVLAVSFLGKWLENRWC